MGPSMSCSERVFTAMGHKEADRVPFLLSATMHGAKELGLSIREYFSKPENVVEGQMRLLRKYRHDFMSGMYFAANEIETWGGEVIFFDDGAPNAGEPFITKSSMITGLTPPRIENSNLAQRILKTISLMKERVGDEVPVVGVVVSPFSVPVMQMGFGRYIRLMYEERPLFEQLMKVNEEFCVSWADAQLAAGATAICCFDPVSSTTITSRQMFLETGLQVAKRVIGRISGPTVMHMGAGACGQIVGDILSTGAAGLGVSSLDDLGVIKDSCRGKVTILGNLNNIEMRNWSAEQAEQEVKKAIASAGAGGGYVLADNFGEIPWQVPDEVLMAISDAVFKWGQYPLTWVRDYEG